MFNFTFFCLFNPQSLMDENWKPYKYPVLDILSHISLSQQAKSLTKHKKYMREISCRFRSLSRICVSDFVQIGREFCSLSKNKIY